MEGWLFGGRGFECDVVGGEIVALDPIYDVTGLLYSELASGEYVKL